MVQAYLDTGFEVVGLEGFDCKKVANYKSYRATNNWLHFIFHILFFHLIFQYGVYIPKRYASKACIYVYV